MDVFFLTDIIMNFFTAVPVGQSLKEGYVVDLKSIGKRYVTGFFFLDLFSSIPFDLINALGTYFFPSLHRSAYNSQVVHKRKCNEFLHSGTVPVGQSQTHDTKHTTQHDTGRSMLLMMGQFDNFFGFLFWWCHSFVEKFKKIFLCKNL